MSLIFIDCGASSGTTFEWFLSKHPEYDGASVFCFEPSPRHWHRLIEIAGQYANRYKITLCPFGLAGQTAFLQLYEKQEASGDSFIHSYGANLNARQMIGSVADAGPFIASFTAPDDELHIKLDCEGGEYGILPSLLSTPVVWNRIRRLMVEFHQGEPIPGMMNELIDRCTKQGHPIEKWEF